MYALRYIHTHSHTHTRTYIYVNYENCVRIDMDFVGLLAALCTAAAVTAVARMCMCAVGGNYYRKSLSVINLK